MLCKIALLKHKLWHLFKRSLKFFNLATFRLKNHKKDDFEIVTIVAKRKFDSSPSDSFVEQEAFLRLRSHDAVMI